MAAVAAGLLAVGVVSILKRDPVQQPLALDPAAGWTEMAWPLSPTPWWPSKAFVCKAMACGGDMTLYVRVKVGFCNCAEGIADDTELERIGDFADLSRRHEPLADGKQIVLDGLKGRSRPYRLQVLGTSGRSVRGIVVGLNSGCDAVVATGVGQTDAPDMPSSERAIATFLDSGPVKRWTRLALGL
jgi:hypothetical protein